jgi:hypothetical protein
MLNLGDNLGVKLKEAVSKCYNVKQSINLFRGIKNIAGFLVVIIKICAISAKNKQLGVFVYLPYI